MTHTPKTTEAPPLTLEDAERLARLAARAASLGLGTTTRSAIVAMVKSLKDALGQIREAGLPADAVEAGRQRAEVEELLTRTQYHDALTMAQHTYMRALARVLRRHVAQCLINQGTSKEDGIRLAWGQQSPPPTHLFSDTGRRLTGSEQRRAA